MRNFKFLLLLFEFPNPKPFIVINLPNTPDVGVIFVTLGVENKVYARLFDGEKFMLFEIIDIIWFPSFPRLGVTQTIFEDVTDWISQFKFPIETWVFSFLSKPFPLIVKTVPPNMLPLFGLIDCIAATPCINKFCFCEALPMP